MKKNSSIGQPILAIVTAVLVTGFFLYMIRDFLLAIFFAGIFAALLRPIHDWFLTRTGSRPLLSSVLTILFTVLVILIPLGAFFGLMVEEAIELEANFEPWIKQHLGTFERLAASLEKTPLVHRFFPDQHILAERLQEIAEKLSGFLVVELSHWTTGTIDFVMKSFVMLYTLFFLLAGGKDLLQRILHIVPASTQLKDRFLTLFLSVTRATIKGTLLIGILQGIAGGVAMGLAGVPHAVFWGGIMIVLSIVPVVGTALVWFPAGVILISGGKIFAGAALLLFGGVVVANIDNFLRPILVGREAKLPELLIFLGTLGGLALFGLAGIVIGPLVASAFYSIWSAYSRNHAELLEVTRISSLEPLPEVEPTSPG